MTKKATRWMAFYVSDYLKKTMRLTTVQHGAYLLLIMACWTEGAPIPADDETLAAIVKMTPGTWRLMAPKILPFFTVSGGQITQSRVEEEREIAERMAETARLNGRKGGRPKKTQTKPSGLSGNNPDETQTKPRRNPAHNPNVTQTETPIPIPPTGEVRDTSPRRAREATPLPLEGQGPLSLKEKSELEAADARGTRGPWVETLRRRLEQYGQVGEPPPLRIVGGTDG